MGKKKFGLAAIVIILAVIAASFGTILTFITDYLWFKELTYTDVFFKKLFTQLQLGIPLFVVVMLLTFVYLKAVKKDYYRKVEFTPDENVSEKTLGRISLGIAAVFAFAATMLTTTQLWFEILRFLNFTEYGSVDPIFNLDISFYLFKFPLISQVVQSLIMLVMGFMVLTLIYYVFLMSARRPKLFGAPEQPEPDPDNVIRPNFANMYYKTNGMQILKIAGRQIMILGAAFFIMLSVNYFLQQFNLLYSARGVLYGAGFTDINVTLWMYRALIALALISAITFVIGIKQSKYKLALAGPILMIVVSLAGTGVATFVQNLVVSPDEINKESQYLEHNIKFTQMAYGLNDIEIKDFAADNNLTKQDISNNIDTINNIRINDYQPTKQFYNQRQSIRLYYLFNDVDVDRYIVDGKYTQVFLSGREIDETQIQDQWLTRHIKYTHGYGITLSKVNSITASGQPDMVIEGIPPVSKIDEIKITRPEIYFGELTNNYIITNTDEEEFDYPVGETNAYSNYEGTAGINLSFFNKVMFSIREQSLKMLVSTNISSDSKVIINRNIAQRVRQILPYLEYDQNPYIVTTDGKLYWIIDAYTYSTYFPYSEPFREETSVNYLRNSVKVVIDAYNGDTSYYVVDENEPIAATLQKIYPTLFKPLKDMPEGLKSHVRYPERMFEIQANVYKKYHMNDVKVFYQGEDLWDISFEIYEQDRVYMKPNYYVMKLPGENDVEFIISVPYTPKNKPNMSGLLIARNDGDNYGKLILYRLPKDKTVYGPMQIESQIDQDTNISKEFSLWGQRGSTYIRGNMFVIPIEQSLLYVEPIYLKAENENSLPEVKRVIVAYGDRIAYESTLDQALESLFGKDATGVPSGGEGTSSGTPTSAPVTIAEIVIRANEAYQNAIDAQKSGRWAEYGNYLEQLNTYLQQLGAAAGVDSAPEEDSVVDNLIIDAADDGTV